MNVRLALPFTRVRVLTLPSTVIDTLPVAGLPPAVTVTATLFVRPGLTVVAARRTDSFGVDFTTGRGVGAVVGSGVGSGVGSVVGGVPQTMASDSATFVGKPVADALTLTVIDAFMSASVRV